MKKIYSIYTRRENKRLSAELNKQGAPSQEKKRKEKKLGSYKLFAPILHNINLANCDGNLHDKSSAYLR